MIPCYCCYYQSKSHIELEYKTLVGRYEQEKAAHNEEKMKHNDVVARLSADKNLIVSTDQANVQALKGLCLRA